jgi:hypothetical protein
MLRSRPWYSYALNAPMHPGTLTPYGNGLDTLAEGGHVLGQKQYELVNHLANVQETVSDKKYRKDDGSSSASIVSVYDYYPFGMLMPGRSVFDTIGMCVTSTHYTEIPHFNWFNGPAFNYSGGDNTEALGTASLSSTSSGGVDATGTTGGLSYVISGITAHAVTVKTFFSTISGPVTVTVWQGTNTGSSGVQLGSISSSGFAPSITAIPVSVGGTSTSPVTITVTVVKTTMAAASYSLFSVDSIGYQTLSYTLGTTLYTKCGQPKDHYEFGFNGQMKTNEIAGVGNHNTALFWEYDTRLGRRWNIDPVNQIGVSNYAAFTNSPISKVDKDGDNPLLVRRWSGKSWF